MGLEYARQLAARGYDLLLVSNREEELSTAKAAIEGEWPVSVTVRYQDLATADAADNLFEWCTSQSGILPDIVINNAGMFFFEEQSEANFAKGEKMRLLHIETPTRLTLLFSEEMKKHRCGYILNMSSMAAKIPAPGLTFYAATKAYLRRFTTSM